MTMPIGIVASSPSGITHATVSQPDGSAMRSSKSRKLGTRMTTICGTSDSDWKSSWPGEVALQAVRNGLVPQQRAVLLLHRERVGRPDDDPERDERPRMLGSATDGSSRSVPSTSVSRRRNR